MDWIYFQHPCTMKCYEEAYNDILSILIKQYSIIPNKRGIGEVILLLYEDKMQQNDLI